MAPAALAALANGASGHAMDYDDTQLSTTPIARSGCSRIRRCRRCRRRWPSPSGWGVSGAAFLEAFLIGFEVECKIAEAIDPKHYNGGFHSSGTIGTFGAAAAAAKLLKLNDAQLGTHAVDRVEPVERHPRELRHR